MVIQQQEQQQQNNQSLIFIGRKFKNINSQWKLENLELC